MPLERKRGQWREQVEPGVDIQSWHVFVLRDMLDEVVCLLL